MGSGASKETELQKQCLSVLTVPKLRKAVHNIQDGHLFIDSEFRGKSALFLDETKNNYEKIEWKHPHQLTKNPTLFVNGVSRLDIEQGDLGDCWFLCACAAITLKTKLVEKVIPQDNHTLNKAGIYHFKFWRFGKWIDVYVDSLLPVVNNQLIYAKSSETNEIWPSLIEKAYAKVNGCYEALNEGKACEGLLDLTGGITEVIYPRDFNLTYLYDILRLSLIHGALIACNTNSEQDSSPKGLVTGHAYSVTFVQSVETASGKEDLLRIFNPWGDQEWNGDWSDKSDKWKSVSEDVLVELGVSLEADGEFWMCFKDFCQYFTRLYICTQGPDFDQDGRVDKSKMYVFDGQWKAGYNAGGCSDNPKKYALNPQYHLTIEPEDISSKACQTMTVDGVKCCYVMISLIQKFNRSVRKTNINAKEEYINFRLYSVQVSLKEKMTAKFFENDEFVPVVLGNQDYSNTREVTGRYLLKPGSYILVPSTYDADVNASYLLRIYAWTSVFSCKPL